MDIRKIISAEPKMSDNRFEIEDKKIKHRKNRFTFVKSYPNFDLYKNNKARLL